MALIHESLIIYNQIANMILEIMHQLWGNKDMPDQKAAILTIAVLLLSVFATFWKVWKDHKQSKREAAIFQQKLRQFSSPEKLKLSIEKKKEDLDSINSKVQRNVKESSEAVLNFEAEEPRLQMKIFERNRLVRKPLIYVTSQERAENKRELEQIQMEKVRESKRKQEEERRIKQQKKKIAAQQESQREQKSAQQIASTQSLRSSQRKTTIQKNLERDQKMNDVNADEPPKISSIFNQSAFNINTKETEKVVDKSKSGQRKQGFSLIPNTKQPEKQQSAKEEKALTANKALGHGSSFGGSRENKKESKEPQKESIPASVSVSQALSLQASPAGVPVKISTTEYLQKIMKFAESQRATVEISTIMANLGGAQSSLSNVLISAQSLLSSINKSEDAQQTTFALKLFDSIIYQIKSSNARDGLYQIPPKSKTSQAEKNAINRYALTVNLYRLMGFEKIWMIVLGKTLRLLEFTYKRQQDIKKLTDLDLLSNKHMDLVGQVEPKYLSRIDYLTYFLMGLLAFDPLAIYRQIEEKDQTVRQSREEVQNFGRQWSYKEFWIYVDLVLKNKHQSYFKPILYMNILSSLFSRVLQHKKNPSSAREYGLLYQTVIELSKKFFGNYERNSQLKALKQEVEGPNYIIDGDNMIQMIKPLNSRLCIQKFNNFNQRGSDAPRDFEAKENIFYYFCKER